jgi:hypothetical protein
MRPDLCVGQSRLGRTPLSTLDSLLPDFRLDFCLFHGFTLPTTTADAIINNNSRVESGIDRSIEPLTHRKKGGTYEEGS